MFKKNQIIRDAMFFLYCTAIVVIATGLIYQITFNDEDEYDFENDIEISEISQVFENLENSQILQKCLSYKNNEKCLNYGNFFTWKNSVLFNKSLILELCDFSDNCLFNKENIIKFSNYQKSKSKNEVNTVDEECEDQEDLTYILGNLFYKFTTAFLAGGIFSTSQFAKLGLV